MHAAVCNDFPRINYASYCNEDVRINYGLPLRDWGADLQLDDVEFHRRRGACLLPH